MIGSMMVIDGTWKGAGVFNVEEFDPDPYMEALNKWGLPWVVDFCSADSCCPWEKYGMWNSFKYRKHLWQERVVRGVICESKMNFVSGRTEMCIGGESAIGEQDELMNYPLHAM